MRREFILLLLGIICVSTLSSLMSSYLPLDTDKVLLDTVEGAVGAGNFSYWQLGHTGPLIIELISLTGDADLFVADHARPSYELDQNNFSSATCGSDIVQLPAEFPRPVGIGIFGHWSHALSQYNIRVYFDATLEGLARYDAGLKRDSVKTDDDKAASNERHEEGRPRILKLLSILDVIFEMIVF